MTDVWTRERVDQLRALYLDPINDWSNAEIAAKIGGITRNSVIGKASRLGLQKPNTSRKAKAHQVKPKPVRKSMAPLPPCAPKFNPQPFVVQDAADIEPLNLSLDDLNDFTCRNPSADEPFTFCGHLPRAGSPYCEAHHRINYLGVPQRKNIKPTAFGQSRGGVFGRVA